MLPVRRALYLMLADVATHGVMVRANSLGNLLKRVAPLGHLNDKGVIAVARANSPSATGNPSTLQDTMDAAPRVSRPLLN